MLAPGDVPPESAGDPSSPLVTGAPTSVRTDQAIVDPVGNLTTSTRLTTRSVLARTRDPYSTRGFAKYTLERNHRSLQPVRRSCRGRHLVSTDRVQESPLGRGEVVHVATGEGCRWYGTIMTGRDGLGEVRATVYRALRASCGTGWPRWCPSSSTWRRGRSSATSKAAAGSRPACVACVCPPDRPLRDFWHELDHL